MRQIGAVTNSRAASRLVDYLAAQGIRARIDEQPTDAAVAIWVYDEDQRERAQELLAQFNLNPADPRYEESAGKARDLAREEAAREKQARRNLVDVRARWDGNDIRRRPVTLALAVICVVVAVLTRFGDRAEAERWVDQLKITPVKHVRLADVPAQAPRNPGPFEWTTREDAVKIHEGLGATLRSQPWRLVTPIFLHFGLLHLVFNMSALMTFGSQIEMRRGAWFLLLLTLIVAVPSNLAQYDMTGRNFGGMSGVVYGMFGYIWMKSRYEPGAGFHMPRNGVLWMLGWLVLCMTGVVGAIADAAHVVGLVMGMALGAAPTLWRGMLRDIRLRRFQKP